MFIPLLKEIVLLILSPFIKKAAEEVAENLTKDDDDCQDEKRKAP